MPPAAAIDCISQRTHSSCAEAHYRRGGIQETSQWLRLPALPARADAAEPGSLLSDFLAPCFLPVQVALTESAHRAKDLAGHLEAVMAANAALKSRTQLLETFMGLQEPSQDAEQTGACQAEVPTDQPYQRQSRRIISQESHRARPLAVTRPDGRRRV